MPTPALSRLFCLCTYVVALAGLTACGNNLDTAAPTHTARAASVAHMPVADCEPQACQSMRIIDSNAETFRVDSARRDALALAVASLEQPATAH
jgi:hypothetical protein